MNVLLNSFNSVGFTVACLVCKRVTDDEASRLFLYLQKISREWSLLNNVTWDKIGAAVADATYGGYVIITGALFVGRLVGELPTRKRVTEFILLGVGAILFVILGSLEFAALDSVPADLVDNAAVIGTLSLVTAGLFLLDMGGPKARKSTTSTRLSSPLRSISKPLELHRSSGQPSQHQHVYDIEKEIERANQERRQSNLESFDKVNNRKDKINNNHHEMKNGNIGNGTGNVITEHGIKQVQSGYKKMSEKEDDRPKRFGIYGKDRESESETDEVDDVPPSLEQHSPVWSKIRKGHYGKYDIVAPEFMYPTVPKHEEQRPPSGPGDPGYVQYTAQHWGAPEPKTPRQSPTQV